MPDLRLALRTYPEEIRAHSHAFQQIVLPHVGGLDIEVDGQRGVVGNGRGIVIPAGAAHRFHAEGRNAFIVLDTIADRRDAASAAGGTRDDAFFVVGAAVQGLLDYAIASLPRGGVSQAAEAAWSALLLERIAIERSRGTDRADAVIARAFAFMRSHRSEAIRTGDIAVAAGLSRSRLRALFSARLGESPHAALARIRLEAAQQLLSSTDLPIAEIALRTGHADQSALTRRLRKARGTTPAALRRAAGGVRSGGSA